MFKELIVDMINKYGFKKTMASLLMSMSGAGIIFTISLYMLPDDLNPDTINNEKENIYEN